MLTERQELILKAIVREYTETGEPVGSKTLSTNSPVKVSSATIRNEMAALEEVGMLTKEHSSSGRVPSVKGYRYYVDHLLDTESVSENDIAIIHNSFKTDFHKIDEIVSKSAAILSNLTSYTVFTLRPEHQDSKLSGFRLVPLGNQQVMAILVTDNGDVASQNFTLPRDVESDEIERVIRLLNDELVGLDLKTVLQRLQTDIPAKIRQYVQSPVGILDIFDDVLAQVAQEQFFVGGRMNLLDFSKSSAPEQLRQVYDLIDESSGMDDILATNNDDINVKIGNEISNKLLKNYSLITATYHTDQFGKGLIAVLGPTRMPYSRTIGIVSAFRQELANQLLKYYHRYYDGK